MSGKGNISAREIAAVVHDVRQMLAVITGRAGLLRQSAVDSVLNENLSSMEQAAIQANAILSRLGSTGASDHSAGCDILQTLELSTSLIVPRSGVSWQRGIPQLDQQSDAWYLEGNIAGKCFTSVPQSILIEVLNNLLLNSLGVMPGGGKLVVDLDKVGENWRLRLQDSGPGIPSHQRDKIFELGFSTSGDADRGVGLSSCRDLMARHGGSLELGETDLPGACFELNLPHTACIVETDQKSADELHFRPTVLVVDDDQAVREMLKDVLVELGCRVKVARDAPAATEIFPTETFEVVIIDQNLPGISGLEFAKALRGQDSHVVLVLISGWGQEEILDKAPGSVIDLVGEKPITVDRIMEILNQAGSLRSRRLEGS